MNETPVNSNTRGRHRLERLIGSSYHQPYHQKKITSMALCVKRFMHMDRLVVISGQFLKGHDTVA